MLSKSTNYLRSGRREYQAIRQILPCVWSSSWRANPFITAKGAAEKLGIAFTTAQCAIQRLQRIGILKLVGDAKREWVFCARTLLDILEEPARLTTAAN